MLEVFNDQIHRIGNQREISFSYMCGIFQFTNHLINPQPFPDAGLLKRILRKFVEPDSEIVQHVRMHVVLVYELCNLFIF